MIVTLCVCEPPLWRFSQTGRESARECTANTGSHVQHLGVAGQASRVRLEQTWDGVILTQAFSVSFHSSWPKWRWLPCGLSRQQL